jgi:hypothetical protein
MSVLKQLKGITKRTIKYLTKDVYDVNSDKHLDEIIKELKGGNKSGVRVNGKTEFEWKALYLEDKSNNRYLGLSDFCREIENCLLGRAILGDEMNIDLPRQSICLYWYINGGIDVELSDYTSNGFKMLIRTKDWYLPTIITFTNSVLSITIDYDKYIDNQNNNTLYDFMFTLDHYLTYYFNIDGNSSFDAEKHNAILDAVSNLL